MGAPRGRCARGEKGKAWASAPDEDATRAARSGRAYRKCSARSSPPQSGAHDSAGQGASKARRSARNITPCLVRRPQFNETGASTPRCLKLQGISAVLRPKLPYEQGGRSSTKRVLLHRNAQRTKVFRQTSARSSSVQSGARDALGRRGREADPDSRSASEGRESAKRERAA